MRALRQEDYDRITDLVWDPEAPRRDAACVFVSGFWADLIFRQTRTDLVVPILTPTRWFLVVFLPALFQNLSEAWLLVLLEKKLISRCQHLIPGCRISLTSQTEQLTAQLPKGQWGQSCAT